MVKKANGKWHMCTDYTDLNKACPKDAYPLPSIDKHVDGVYGFQLLSFLVTCFFFFVFPFHNKGFRRKKNFVVKSNMRDVRSLSRAAV